MDDDVEDEDRHPRWTDEERDEWMRDMRRRHPALVFAPSTAHLADRFGRRNREDREKEQKRTDGPGSAV